MHSNIDPAFLRTYIAVVETGSLTSAAKVVGKTVGALSYQISRLETSLGQKLFARAGARLALSEYGYQFLPEARFLLKIHDQISDGKASVSSFMPTPLADTSLQNIVNAKPSFTDSLRRVNIFKSNLETQLLRNVFSMWQSFHAEGKELLLDDLIKSGTVSLAKNNFFLVDDDLRCIAASEEPARLFQLDKNGFGRTLEQIWKSKKPGEKRRKIFSICKDAESPVFFSGNAPYRGIQILTRAQ